MTGNRIRVGFALAVLGIALSTGTASAQVGGCNFSDTSCGEVAPNNEATTPTIGNETQAEVETNPAAGESPSLAFTEPASEPTLPFTGADVAGLVGMGLAAVGVGTVLVRRTRTRSAE
jgi:hypothetical protein